MVARRRILLAGPRRAPHRYRRSSFRIRQPLVPRPPGKKYPKLIFNETELALIREACSIYRQQTKTRGMDEEIKVSKDKRMEEVLARLRRREARQKLKESSRKMSAETVPAVIAVPEKKKKRLTKAEREEAAIRFIDEYRKNMLKKANKEFKKDRRSLKLDIEEPKPSRITFNPNKEVLEFSNSFHPSFNPLPAADPDANGPTYQVRSALKGSQEVYVGELQNRFTVLTSKKSVSKEVPELRDIRDARVKTPEKKK